MNAGSREIFAAAGIEHLQLLAGKGLELNSARGVVFPDDPGQIAVHPVQIAPALNARHRTAAGVLPDRRVIHPDFSGVVGDPQPLVPVEGLHIHIAVHKAGVAVEHGQIARCRDATHEGVADGGVLFPAEFLIFGRVLVVQHHRQSEGVLRQQFQNPGGCDAGMGLAVDVAVKIHAHIQPGRRRAGHIALKIRVCHNAAVAVGVAQPHEGEGIARGLHPRPVHIALIPAHVHARSGWVDFVFQCHFSLLSQAM